MTDTDRAVRKRAKRRRIVGLAITVLLGVFGVWVTWTAHQVQLIQECRESIQQNRTERVLALIEAGINPNAPVYNGLQPSMWTLIRNRLQGQSAPSRDTYTLFTLLFLPINREDESYGLPIPNDTELARVTEVMLLHGADVNSRMLGGRGGSVPLSEVVRLEMPRTVQTLLTHGADPNRVSDDGDTPLMWASMNGNLSMVQMLLAHGSDVRHVEQNGTNALMWACMGGDNLSVVEALLVHNADIHARTPSGYTALKYAERSEAVKVAALLRRHGARE